MTYVSIRGHDSGSGAEVGSTGGVWDYRARVRVNIRVCLSEFSARGYKVCFATRGLQIGAPRKLCTKLCKLNVEQWFGKTSVTITKHSIYRYIPNEKYQR